MLRGVYAAATGLDSAQQRQEVIAHNLSHVNTPGYKARGVRNETFDIQLQRGEAPVGEVLGTKVRDTFADFTAGPIQYTNNPLDIAITNDGFFVLDGPNGQRLYSRAGNFKINDQGQIVNQGGYPLRTNLGPINVTGGGKIEIATDGGITINGAFAGQLEMVRFTRPGNLVAVGPSLFRAPNGSGLQNIQPNVQQGYREGSNVQPAEAMVQLISGLRYFEAAQRALKAITDSIQLNTRPQ